MKEKVVNSIMKSIKSNNPNLSDTKLEEIKYGLYGLYTLITKTTVIILLSILLGFIKEFIIFFIFYGLLRGVGYGTHAKSNIACWFFSTVLLIGIPYLIYNLGINNKVIILLWSLCFINYLIFCPADTEKRPMINKKRKLKFKLAIILLSLFYLLLIIKFKDISNLIISAMLLEALLTNPLGYILMGQKSRFKLCYIFKQNKK